MQVQRVRAFAAAVVLIVALSPGPANADGTANAGPAVQVGQVLATGTKTATGCRFDEPVQITLDIEPGETASKNVSLAISDGCRVRVTALWRGQPSGGPAGASDLSGVRASRGGIVSAEEMSSGKGFVPLSLSGCKSVTQTAWMYGFGGSGDDLTRVSNYMDFCWDAGEVWKTNGGGGCGGSHPAYWSWVIDACTWPANTWGPSTSSVYGTIRGDFHCDPINVLPCSLGGGYIHQLYAKDTGYPTGAASCTYWFGGQIVNGMTHTVVNCTG